MTQQIYIVNNLPGTSGNLISGLITDHYTATSRQVSRDDGVYSEEKPTEMSADWFYQHWSLNLELSNIHVHNVHFLPRYDVISNLYPTAKQITITHDIEDCDVIAANLFYTHYIDAWETGIPANNFASMIASYPNFFPDLSATPSTLTEKQKNIFIKLLSHQVLFSGFHSIDVPLSDNIYEIKFHDMLYNPKVVKTQLAEIIGETLAPEVSANYTGFLMTYINRFYKHK